MWNLRLYENTSQRIMGVPRWEHTVIFQLGVRGGPPPGRMSKHSNYEPISADLNKGSFKYLILFFVIA